jgi:hypothetical protein
MKVYPTPHGEQPDLELIAIVENGNVLLAKDINETGYLSIAQDNHQQSEPILPPAKEGNDGRR